MINNTILVTIQTMKKQDMVYRCKWIFIRINPNDSNKNIKRKPVLKLRVNKLKRKI